VRERWQGRGPFLFEREAGEEKIERRVTRRKESEVKDRKEGKSLQLTRIALPGGNVGLRGLAETKSDRKMDHKVGDPKLEGFFGGFEPWRQKKKGKLRDLQPGWGIFNF